MNDAWLAHHGVLGQKKGRRRWQNLDGSYTAAGRIHYGIGQGRKHDRDLHKDQTDRIRMKGRYDSANNNPIKNAVDKLNDIGKRKTGNKYVDGDGNLTKAGQERYDRLKRRNDQKPKDKRAKDEESLKDPDKWVEDDIKGAKNAVENARNLTRSLEDLERATNRGPKENKRLDLSKMTDKELRDKINREMLERQYNQVFNPPTVNRGREAVKDILAVGGSVLGVASSALGIALAIQQLKNGTGGGN